MDWIGTGTLEIPLNHEFEHALAGGAPGFVGVGIITYGLGGGHERGDEVMVSRRTTSDNEPGLQSLQKIESSKGRRP